MTAAPRNNQGRNVSLEALNVRGPRYLIKMTILAKHPLCGFQHSSRNMVLNYSSDGALVSVADPGKPFDQPLTLEAWTEMYNAIKAKNEKNWRIVSGQMPASEPKIEVSPLPKKQIICHRRNTL